MRMYFKVFARGLGIIAAAAVVLSGMLAVCYYASPTADKLLVDVIGKQHPVVTGVIVWKFNGREILTRIPDNIKPEIIISEEVKQPMVQFYFDEDWLRERVPSSYAADLMEKGRIKLKKVLILKPKN